mmetsp:Transcript_40271/g.129455  ORF Transcript_40271/g.129455 Transcript_40271/m.129455 type:complete len:205 (+) Transcript_40271:490-1104(+)
MCDEADAKLLGGRRVLRREAREARGADAARELPPKRGHAAAATLTLDEERRRVLDIVEEHRPAVGRHLFVVVSHPVVRVVAVDEAQPDAPLAPRAAAEPRAQALARHEADVELAHQRVCLAGDVGAVDVDRRGAKGGRPGRVDAVVHGEAAQVGRDEHACPCAEDAHLDVRADRLLGCKRADRRQRRRELQRLLPQPAAHVALV